jgi:cytochrome c oxidase assembly factor CtaG
MDPGPIALLIVAAGLYCLGMRRCRRRWPVWRAASFFTGLTVLGVALLSGVDGYADELLSVHMAQHLLLLLVAPALLLWGAPLRLALAASAHEARSLLATVLSSCAIRVVSRPPVGFAVFTVAVLATHLTGLFELALADRTVHTFEHAAYFWAGIMLLAPLIAADPLSHRPSAIARFSWLMGAMVVMAVPGALLTFSTSVRYRFYLTPARALGRSALSDQHLAGAIMWVGGGIVMFALALTLAMGAMLAEERHQQRRDLHAGPVEPTPTSTGALGA